MDGDDWGERRGKSESQIRLHEEPRSINLKRHPRSRILSMIDDGNLPFASRDDLLFIKARSCSVRENDEGSQKDALDFVRLSVEIPAPLRFEGFDDDVLVKSMKKDILKRLDDLAHRAGVPKQRLMDLLEL